MKLFIDKVGEDILNILTDGKRILEVHSMNNSTISLGSIYVGKVYKIKKSINSAFLKIAGNVDVYLPINEKDKYIYVKNINGKDNLCQSDEILVQVVKYGSGSKLCAVTNIINIHSDNFVLVTDKKGVFVSKKIEDDRVKNIIKSILSNYKNYNIGIIARSSSDDVHSKYLEKELLKLVKDYVAIIDKLSILPVNSLVFKPDSEVHILNELRRKYNFEIVARESYDYDFNALGIDFKLVTEDRFDELAITYNIKDNLRKLFRKKVLLKSGANIVIEKTEAMYVIDVNSHKSSMSKHNQKAVFKNNLEASKEIVRQIIARNLSGIIVVDFINMKDEVLNKKLIEEMQKYSVGFGAKILIHGLTKLSLMEITRKKTGLDIYEDSIVRAFIN